MKTAPRERFEIKNFLDGDHHQETIQAIRTGLTQPQKKLPSSFFYDAHGSSLFERICGTPEYYLTDTELSILDGAAAEIMDFFTQAGGDLIELGSGSNRKVRKLLDAANSSRLARLRYVPVDISPAALTEAAQGLLASYQELSILGIVADFTHHLEVLPDGRKLMTFLGSSIGNFNEEESAAFLKGLAGIMTPEDRFILGLDMVKPVEVIEAAYNDRQGVTGQFNLNILHRLNRDLDADFDPNDFEHLAFFNQEAECVEMHLRAKRAVRANISALKLSVDLAPEETIHTEICRKFSPESAERLFEEAGLSVSNWWRDPKGWFSLVELKKAARVAPPK